MRRCFTLLTCLVALAGPSSSGAGPQVDSGALLRKFEPVLFFHPQEDWSPEHAEGFVGRARVEKQVARGSWVSAPPPLPTNTSGCSFTPCYRFNLSCALRSGDACYEASRDAISDWKHPVVYGRVLTVPAGSPAPAGFSTPPRYLVRYWLFYEFDDWRSPRRRLWQAHEGDWESVTIGLSATQQSAAARIPSRTSRSARMRITSRTQPTRRSSRNACASTSAGPSSRVLRASSSLPRIGSSIGWALHIHRARAVSPARRRSSSSSSRSRFRRGPRSLGVGARGSSCGSGRRRTASRASWKPAGLPHRTGTAPRFRRTGTRARASGPISGS